MSDIDLTLFQINREEEEKHAKDTAAKLKLPYISLISYPITAEVLNTIPKEQATTYQVVPYLRSGNTVRVATNQPSEELDKFLAEIGQASKNQFLVSLCSESSLKYALTMYDKILVEAPKTGKIEVTEEKEKNFEEQIKTFQDLQQKITQVSTTELLDVIFAGAMKHNATDIHIEPGEKTFRIRYRIDGILQDVANLPQESFHALVSRIKYQAKLKLDVNSPQDGRFEAEVSGQSVDVRVSSLPTSFGEAIVLRILPKNKDFITLENLGFTPETLKLINEAIAKPQGLILNTGPTGSGKTTTLYAILQKLNQPGRKIITLENPIEYQIEGIEQIQIDADNKTGFLDALKATLRQDPDVLMVGEIRDNETANIALQAAMTGHLVLSTLHANNAPSALARLVEMGVQPYLLGGSINLIIGQRLVRKVCENCQGKGCETCNNSGYKGRIAIVEALVPTPEIEELIQKRAPLRTFEEVAHKLGMKTMHEDGLEKVAQGITTKEEVERVTLK